MSLDIGNSFIVVLQKCACKDNLPQMNADGYILGGPQRRCSKCFGTGTIKKQMTLADLKTLLGI